MSLRHLRLSQQSVFLSEITNCFYTLNNFKKRPDVFNKIKYFLNLAISRPFLKHVFGTAITKNTYNFENKRHGANVHYYWCKAILSRQFLTVLIWSQKENIFTYEIVL
jgi:hypothetical protein